jgi:hypothetical protein
LEVAMCIILSPEGSKYFLLFGLLYGFAYIESLLLDSTRIPFSRNTFITPSPHAKNNRYQKINVEWGNLGLTVCMFLTYIIVTYAYICFCNCSNIFHNTSSMLLQCSPTYCLHNSKASVIYLCPFIIDALPLDQ